MTTTAMMTTAMTTKAMTTIAMADATLSIPLGYRSPTLGGRTGRVQSWQHLDHLVDHARADGEWFLLHRLDDPAERFLQLRPISPERTAIQIGERRAETQRHAVWSLERATPPAPELHGMVLDWLGGSSSPAPVDPEQRLDGDDEPF